MVATTESGAIAVSGGIGSVESYVSLLESAVATQGSGAIAGSEGVTASVYLYASSVLLLQLRKFCAVCVCARAGTDGLLGGMDVTLEKFSLKLLHKQLTVCSRRCLGTVIPEAFWECYHCLQ